MSRKLALKLGLGVGISSGANLIASIIAKEENEGKMVTVFPDDNKKYLSTDLGKVDQEEVGRVLRDCVENNIDKKENEIIKVTNKDFISNKIELFDYEFV